MAERWPDWIEWPLTLYAHGGGRELSSKQWDDYKEPVGEVVPARDLDAAVEALEPFAKAGDEWADAELPRDDRTLVYGRHDGISARISVADLLRARSTLHKLRGTD